MWLLCAMLTAVVQDSAAMIPPWMYGRWAGNATTSELGPRSFSPGQDFLVVSKPAADGSIYMRHVTESQLFRIRGKDIIYCFSYDHPDLPVTGADFAPFQFAPGGEDEQELNICWKGPRLPSHAANCTGCDCAHWTLKLAGTTLKSTFLQSPPVLHLSIDLHQTNSTPPTSEEVRAGWDCEFSDATGSHIHTGPTSHKKMPMVCPARADSQARRHAVAVPIPKPDGSGKVKNCLILSGGAAGGVYMEYVASTNLFGSCMPCDVTFTLSIPTLAATGKYVAIGFKGSYAAYYNSTLTPEIPNYWGMQNDDQHNISELSGRIVVGFLDKTGKGCVRQMRADAYVGSVVDVPSDGLVHSMEATNAHGRTNLVFTAKVHLGKDATDINWQQAGGRFGNLRVMWATGPVGGDGGCTAPIGFHNGDRALASLNFPGYGFPVTCSAEGMATPQRETMLHTDFVVV